MNTTHNVALESMPFTSDQMRAWRERMGYTQEQAAQALGFGRVGYLGMEKRGGILSVTLAMKYLEMHRALAFVRVILTSP